MAKYHLPKIGDGTGGTVTLAAFAADLAAFVATGNNALEVTELYDARGQRVAIIPAKARKLFVVQDNAGRQFWTTSDDPNALGNADAPDWPTGGGGPHALTHENNGSDEIDISALSGLLADPQAPLAHTHIIADTTGLQTTLDGKASLVHSHSISDVTSLQTTLDGKAALVHTHAIADTTGLQTALNGKAASVHTHDSADVVSGTLAIARIPTGQTSTTVPLGNDARFTDARTPLAHAASHKSGGSDAIKLDELAAPTDVTTLNASTTQHGLLPKLPGGTTTFLRADGTFAAPLPAVLGDAATADVLANAADTYLKGLLLAGRLKAGTVIRLRGRMTKTAAGVAAPIFNVRVGTAGSTADTARCVLTAAAQTAASDTGWFELEIVVRVFSASGVLSASLRLDHLLTTTGFATSVVQYLNVASATFDLTPAGTIIGLSVNPGSSGVWTFQTVTIEAFNLA